MSTTDNELEILQYSGVLSKGSGDDKYIVSTNTVAEGANIQITDTLGLNTIQLHGGLTIASSQVAANGALLLKLSNSAQITILGASEFQFEIGGSALSGVAGDMFSFDEFVNQYLGVEVPTAGVVSGAGSVTIPVPVTGSNSGAFIDDAAVISVDDVFTGAVTQPGEIAWHEVTLNAGQIYQIDAMSDVSAQFGNTLGDPAISSIYDSNGRMVANAFDDNSGDGNNARLFFEPSASGVYFIPITSSAYSNQALTGGYELSVKETTQKIFVETEENNTTSTADDFNITFDNYVLQGRVNAEEETDYFLVSAASGGLISFDFQHPDGVGDSGEEVDISLTDAQGNVVFDWYGLKGSRSFQAAVDKAGTYILKVADHDSYGSASSTGTYQVAMQFESLNNVAYDGTPNGTINTAFSTLADQQTPISFDGHSLIGVTSLHRDADYFKVNAASGGEIILDFTHPQGIGTQGIEMDVAVYDESGRYVLSRTLRGSEVLNATLSVGGDYFVKVADHDEYDREFTQTAYRVDMQFNTSDAAFDGMHNNTMNEAQQTLADGVTPINFDGDVIKGAISAENDTDYFAIEASSGGAITLDFSHPDGIGNQGTEIIVALYDQFGNAALNSTLKGNSIMHTTVDEAGIYFLKVEDRNESSNVFSKSLYQFDLEFESDALTSYDSASNSTMNAANGVLSDGQTALTFSDGHIQGAFSHDEDADYFAVQANFVGDVTLDFIHPEGLGVQGHRIDISMYDQAGNRLFEQEVTGSTTLSATLDSVGTYFIGIEDVRSYPDSYAEGFYQLDLSYA